MPSLIRCPDPIVLQEICDQLNELRILYLSQTNELEIIVKSEPSFLERVLAESGLDADVLTSD